MEIQLTANFKDSVLPNPGVYVIEHPSTGKFYVGSSVNVRKRVINHQSMLRNNKHPCVELQAVYNQTPEIRVLAASTNGDKEAMAEEQRLVNALSVAHPTLLLNVCLVDVNSPKGLRKSEDTRKKIGDSQRGIPESPESIEKRRKAMLGHPTSAETRRKISEANLGRVVSAETRERMRQSQTGRTLPESQKAKIRENSQRRPVVIDGVEYPSISAAGRELGIGVGTVYSRAGISTLKQEG
jgi:group I intron endonuclease